jgi:uncharacterized membrane protein
LTTNPIPKSHVWIIYTILTVAPIGGLIFIKGNQSIWDINYLFYGGLVLVGILLLVTLADIIIKKPYLALFFGCHQSSSRSFRFGSKILPLCARCTGIYFGIVLFPFIMFLESIPIYVYLILGLPLIIDGLLQLKKGISSTNPRRFVTGLLFGGTLITLFTLYQVMMVWLSEWILSWF